MTQINRLATSKAASVNSDSGESVRLSRKKREMTDVITSHKQQGGKTQKHHGAQLYCVLCKNSGIPE